MKTMTFFAAGLTLALCTAVMAQEGAVMTHEEFLKAAVDDEVTVETYVQSVRDFGEDVATVYAQSEDGAYFIYDAACSQEDYEKLTEGAAIRVTGYKAEWSGEIEIMDGSIQILDKEPYIAEASDLTELLGTEELEDHMNEKFLLKEMTVAEAGEEGDAFLYNWDGSGQEGDDLYFNLEKDGKVYSFTVRTDMYDASSPLYKAVKELSVGDVVDVSGYMYWYEGPNPHVTDLTVSK